MKTSSGLRADVSPFRWIAGSLSQQHCSKFFLEEKMKLAILHLLFAAAAASIYVPSPTMQLESSLPDSRFRKELIFNVPLLPVNPTFMNILNFMGTVAVSDFHELIEPDTYTSPMYPQVQISIDRWTEARFLLWGIYLTAIDMAKFGRFNNVLIKLYWVNNLVGQMSLMAKPSLELPGIIRNDTRGVIDDSGEPSLAKINRNIMSSSVERLKILPIQNTTRADIVSVISSNNKRLFTTSVLLRPLNHSSPNASLSTTLSISFVRVAGAKKCTRNDVFLTFYTAILHLAKLPAENNMRSFNSKLPSADLRVEMSETGFGCSVNSRLVLSVYFPTCK